LESFDKNNPEMGIDSVARQMHQKTVEHRQNSRKMTSFRGAMAKLGAGVDNELGGSALHQCR